LQFSLAKKFDIFIIIIGIISSLGLAISMPLFSILFGGTLNNLGSNPVGLFESIKELCLKFVYVGLGMFVAGTLMICCWSYSGRRIANYIKEEYFSIIMRQEQGWFDQQEVFEFSTRIQNQTKIIENGVNINYKYKVCIKLVYAYKLNY
jgi:ATP-binding cassette subfamily B (MDR/TAP) protein 1